MGGSTLNKTANSIQNSLQDSLQNPQNPLQNPHDSTNDSHNPKPFSIAQSLEVAEHLDAAYARNFITLLCALSDIVIFSAAIPFQGGTHHVNENTPQFWAQIFGERGFVCFDILRAQLWENPRVACWYKQNALIFAHKSKAQIFAPHAPCAPHYLVHPELWEAKSKWLENVNNSVMFRVSRKIPAWVKKPVKKVLG